MIELWIGGIVATIAACIWAAWGPKALLKVMGTMAVMFVVGSIWWTYETARQRNLVYASHCFELPVTVPGSGDYYSPEECRKAGGVPYAEYLPDAYKRLGGK